MWMGRTQESSVEHAWEHDVVGIECPPGHFGVGINFWPGFTDDFIGTFGCSELVIGRNELMGTVCGPYFLIGSSSSSSSSNG